MGKVNTRQLLSVISSIAAKPSINLHHFDKITDGFYSSVFSLPYDKNFSFADYNAAVAELTANTFQIYEGSLVNVDDKAYRCILASNVESKPYNEENAKGLVAVRANEFKQPGSLFIDEQEVIWKLIGDEGDKRLVRVTKENFDAILEAKRSRTPITASVGEVIPYEDGDYAYFFNHEINAMDFGIVVEQRERNNDSIFSRSTEKLVKLNTPSQVVLANNLREKSPTKERARMSITAGFTVQKYLDFIRKMYGANNPYYKALEAAIKKHAVA